VLGGRAVHADGRHLGERRQAAHDLHEWRSVAQAPSVTAGEAEPGPGRWCFAEQAREGARLGRRGNRLAGQELGVRFRQQAEPLAVEGDEARFAEVVVAGVLRAVRQVGAVGSDARGYERALASGPALRVLPEGVARCLGQADASQEERAGLGPRTVAW
jgi:hypothetical protein